MITWWDAGAPTPRKDQQTRKMKIYLKQSEVGVMPLQTTLTVKKVNKKILTAEMKTRKRRPKLSRRLRSPKSLNLEKNASNRTWGPTGSSWPKTRLLRKKFTINVERSKNGRRLSNWGVTRYSSLIWPPNPTVPLFITSTALFTFTKTKARFAWYPRLPQFHPQRPKSQTKWHQKQSRSLRRSSSLQKSRNRNNRK